MPRKKIVSPEEPKEEPAEEPKKEPTELELIESEMKGISPTLHSLKHSNREKYETTYRRYMQLVLRRDEILKGNP